MYEKKSRMTYDISHNTAKIKVDSNDSLPLEKALSFKTHSLSQFFIKIRITIIIIYS